MANIDQDLLRDLSILMEQGKGTSTGSVSQNVKDLVSQIVDCEGVYTGETWNGMKHGQGIAQYNSGDKYVGEWRRNMKCGQGIIYYNDGGKYIGYWRDNMKVGEGIEYHNDGTKENKKYQDGNQVEEVGIGKSGNILLKINGKYGLINNKGQQTVPCEYDIINAYAGMGYYPGILSISRNGKYGIINDETGQISIECVHEKSEIYCSLIESHWGGKVIGIEKNLKTTLFDLNGIKISEKPYDKVGRVNLHELENAYPIIGRVYRNGKEGGINMYGDEIIPCEYYNMSFLWDKVIRAEKNGKCGLMTTSGEELIEFIYDDMPFYRERGQFEAILNGRKRLIDESGYYINE